MAGRDGGIFERFMHWLDHRVGWHRLPRVLGILDLVAIRNRLRRDNMHDLGAPPAVEAAIEPFREEFATTRTIDGSHNSLDQPAMGAKGSRFGRNVDIDLTWPEPTDRILTPNPRDVSLRLMTRHRLQEATTLNLLAAAWLQFQVHDWFAHEPFDWDDVWSIDLSDSDTWFERPMRIPLADPDASGTGDPDSPPMWINNDTHWWDASQLYGRDLEYASKARTFEGGRLRVDDSGLVPRDVEEDLDRTDVFGNLWVGSALIHNLFTLEHNAICDRLRAEYPTWSDEQLYQKARLVNAALMAKIHTVEWTPAIIAHPTTRWAMRINWWGIAGRRAKRRWGRLSKSDIVSGIPGSLTRFDGSPFSLTEEFTAVYRMHPLVLDDYPFRAAADDAAIATHPFPEINALHTHDRLEEIGSANALYSFGTLHPGAITLHNFPRFLQDLDRPDGTKLDLAATDILRIRERGVPRYSAFRRQMHMRPIRAWDQMTPHPEWQEDLREVYEDDLEAVDLMVGMFAENPPRGFGFSDTAFRIFVLMASRRLNCDRFFTTDYRPEVYTQAGLDWIDDNTFITVLLRHHPELAPALAGVDNGFAPWAHTG